MAILHPKLEIFYYKNVWHVNLELIHLGHGRALAAAREKEKARIAYQDFLTLWKDADPDIPIYKAAKAEYASLQ
jgi:hypothetical protein